ncbi:hypothetical protein [Micromonospora sp. NPDC048830]|uniref:hypothetical protein n=1 Tax=Micromonospora sp. NPDC048830 TaxID=3364257 RepID=UPI00371970E8
MGIQGLAPEENPPDLSVGIVNYLAGCLHEAIDDLHTLNPSVTGGAADMFDRFLGWPARHSRFCRMITTGSRRPRRQRTERHRPHHR